MLLQNNWSQTTYETLCDLIERKKSSSDTPKYERNYVVTVCLAKNFHLCLQKTLR